MINAIRSCFGRATANNKDKFAITFYAVRQKLQKHQMGLEHYNWLRNYPQDKIKYVSETPYITLHTKLNQYFENNNIIVDTPANAQKGHYWSHIFESFTHSHLVHEIDAEIMKAKRLITGSPEPDKRNWFDCPLRERCQPECRLYDLVDYENKFLS